MRGFLNLLKPSEWRKGVLEIDFDELLSKGFRVFIFDYDNTLVPWRSKEIPERVLKILDHLSERALVIIASNGRRKEVKGLKWKAVWRAGKPFSKRLVSLLESMNVDRNEVVVIGDQIFTDVFFGNRMGFYTIKVEPISKKEFWGTKVLRFLEKLVFPFIR